MIRHSAKLFCLLFLVLIAQQRSSAQSAVGPQINCSSFSGSGPTATCTAFSLGQLAGVAAESFGASPSASASTNTTAIQSALNLGGTVTLSTCGTYQFNGPLAAPKGGNLYLRVSPCVTLKQANSNNNNLFVNWAYANRGYVSTGLTYSSGASGCANGTQTVTFTNGNPAVAAIGTITVSGGVPTGAVTIGLPGGTNGGSLYQSVPTQGTITTCTGTATFSGGAITGKGTAVTLTYTSGMTVSVAWTNHGFAVPGGYVLLANSSPTNFNGVFKISSITDSNNFVVEMTHFPLATNTGSAVAIACDQHITIEGGVWDYNGTNQGTSSNQLADAVLFGFAEDVRLTRMIVNNVNKYAFGFGGVRDVTTEQVGSDFTMSDEIKVFGPAKDVHLLRTFGKNGDDGISFQPNPAPGGYPQTNWSTGDIMNSGADGVDLDDPGGSSSAAVAFFPDATDYMGGMYARNVSGTRDRGGVAVAGTASSTMDTLQLQNINASSINEIYVNSVTIGSLEIFGETINPNASSGGPNLLQEGSTATINKMLIDGCNLNNTGIPSSGVMVFVQIAGVVNEMNVRNCLINGSAVGANPPRFIRFYGGSSPGKINVDSVFMPNGDTFITLDSGVLTTPTISITNSNIGAKTAVTASSSANVVFTGNTFVNCSTGCIYTVGSVTVALGGSGNNLAAGSWIFIASGTPTFTSQFTIEGTCTNIAPASATIRLYGLGNTSTATCTSALTTTGDGQVIGVATTIPGMSVTAATGGINASSGAVTVLKNGTATAITCTLGTGTTCQDYAHSTAFAAGDILSVQFTTQAAETLAAVKASVLRLL
jgi:hypothetical protein